VLRNHTAKNCHIFIWTTQTCLRDALKMVGEWEKEKLLQYGCMFVWHKQEW
jgi:hypothetical protein